MLQNKLPRSKWPSATRASVVSWHPGLTDEDRKKPEKIWTLLEEQLDASTHINYIVHRLGLSNMLQKSGESITEYVSRLRQKAAKCEFMPKNLQGDELSERLIEMIIISIPFEEFRKELAKPKGCACSGA